MSDPILIVTPHPRHWRIDPRHALVAAALFWTGFALVLALFESGHTAALDRTGLLIWREAGGLGPRGPDALLDMMRGLTGLGGATLRNLIAATAITALLLIRLRREALVLLVTVGTGALLNSALKSLIGRERPAIVPHLVEAGGASFPSGHSFNGAVVCIGIALAFAALSPRRPVRWAIIGSAVTLSLLIAFSRVWLGVHYPSDVAAGWLGGAGWALLASALLYKPAGAIAAVGD